MAPAIARVPRIVQRYAALKRPALSARYREAPPQPRLFLDEAVGQLVLRAGVQAPRGDGSSVVARHVQKLTIMEPRAALLHGADKPRAGLDPHHLAQGRLAFQPEGLSSRARPLGPAYSRAFECCARGTGSSRRSLSRETRRVPGPAPRPRAGRSASRPRPARSISRRAPGRSFCSLSTSVARRPRSS